MQQTKKREGQVSAGKLMLLIQTWKKRLGFFLALLVLLASYPAQETWHRAAGFPGPSDAVAAATFLFGVFFAVPSVCSFHNKPAAAVVGEVPPLDAGPSRLRRTRHRPPQRPQPWPWTALDRPGDSNLTWMVTETLGLLARATQGRRRKKNKRKRKIQKGGM